jgi:hypothetical protein
MGFIALFAAVYPSRELPYAGNCDIMAHTNRKFKMQSLIAYQYTPNALLAFKWPALVAHGPMRFLRSGGAGRFFLSHFMLKLC